MKILFEEEQKFIQWWLWILLIGIGIIPIVGIYKQIILGESFGNNPMSDLGLIIFTIFVFGILILFWTIRLKTAIDSEEIRMTFFPFTKRKVKWKNVKSAKVITYGFVGYGIRGGGKYGTIYNTNGNKGLAIELQDGTKFVIGTQKEEELNEIVQSSSPQ